MSILVDVKLNIGINPEESHFDQDLVSLINGGFSSLAQLGVNYNIVVDESTDWPDFPSATMSGLTKEFICRKVKSIFDPTASATIKESLHTYITELEGRIMLEVEHPEV